MKDFKKLFFSKLEVNPTVLDPLHSGIAIYDCNAELVYANKTYLEMYRLQPDSYVGIKAKDLFITADKGIFQVLKTGQVNSCMSITVDGYYGFTNRYPLHDKKGNVVGCIVENLSVGLDRQRVYELQKIISSFQAEDSVMPEPSPRQDEHTTFDMIIGETPAMKILVNKGLRFAQNDEPILILGENGVGKDMVAQAVHAASPRCSKKFIAVNCAALPLELMESELFGYEGGAFTGARASGKKGKFEEADGGTIFLDEIAELPLKLQAKLLRVLENHEVQKIGSTHPVIVDFRLVSATNRNLEQLVERGEFREDLFYRLNLFELTVPPLRERLPDIPLIANAICHRILGREKANALRIAPEVLALFSMHTWKGNVRELRNILTYAIYSMGPGDTVLNVPHLPDRFFSKSKKVFLNENVTEFGEQKFEQPAQSFAHSSKLRRNREDAEAILQALRQTKGNKVLAARYLGMARSNLYKKISSLGLEAEISRLPY